MTVAGGYKTLAVGNWDIPLIILGIDPGTHAAGYAFLKNERAALAILAAGLIPIRGEERQGRLSSLHVELARLIKKWRPEALSIERLFFTKNQKTAFAVAEARGVILLTCALARIPAFEYTPLEIKKIVTGYGGADKLQVQKMVALILPDLHIPNAPDDVFDAIAAALAFCYKEKTWRESPPRSKSSTIKKGRTF